MLKISVNAVMGSGRVFGKEEEEEEGLYSLAAIKDLEELGKLMLSKGTELQLNYV